MDLLDRYLAAVARELPKRQADDITAELRDTLLSKIEEKEESLGRPLTKPELDALLVEFGHPLVVAGRYRKVQYLIGPEVFPFWWAAQRIVLTVAAIAWIALLAIRIVSDPAAQTQVITQAAASIWPIALALFGGVTLTFVVMERLGLGSRLRRFSVPRLPAPTVKRKGRSGAGVGIALGLVFILWWLGLIRFSDLIPSYSPIKAHLGPIFAQLFAPILAYAIADVSANAIALVQPSRQRLNAALSLACNVAGGVVVFLVLRAGDWVVLTGPGLTPDMAAGMERPIDLGLRIAFTISVLSFTGKAVYDAWRLLRGPTGGADAQSARPSAQAS